MSDYYIQSGVRRCIATRELGRQAISAMIVETGKPDMFATIALAALHSPKTVIICDARYLRIQQAMQNGLLLPPIEVQPLGAAGQGKATPLSQVQLL